VRLPVAIAIATSLMALAACVARLPIEGAGCPCPAGYCCLAGACVPKSSGRCPPEISTSGQASRDGSPVGGLDSGGPALSESGPPPVDTAAPDQASPADASDGPTADASDGPTGDAPSCSAAVTPLCDEGPAAGDACNPTCQTGCTCGHRCAVSNGGTLCLLNYGRAKPGDLCQTPGAVGHVAEDACEPGSVCLREPCGAIARCYRVCERDEQCDRGSCTVPVVTYAPDLSTKFKACTLPPRTCDPLSNTGCPSPYLGCFLTSAGTVCDCPTAASALNASCQRSTDCLPGLTCDPAGSGAATCERVCEVGRPDTCATGACVKSPGATPYGVCHQMP
jgi:hypothetical protein